MDYDEVSKAFTISMDVRWGGGGGGLQGVVCTCMYVCTLLDECVCMHALSVHVCSVCVCVMFVWLCVCVTVCVFVCVCVCVCVCGLDIKSNLVGVLQQ